MLAGLMKYGGLAAKIRAMYGCRLKKTDFENMASMGSVPEIALYLRAHPGWEGSLKSLTQADMHRGIIEEKLKEHLLSEYQRIFRFVAKEDHPIMRYPIMRVEIDQILFFLRCLRAGEPQKYVFSAPAFYRVHSDIDFFALRACANYPMFLDVIRRTAYYVPLVALSTPGGGVPDQAVAEAVLYSLYFNHMLSAADRYYGGGVRRVIRTNIGMQVDLLNIMHVIRMRRFFNIPASEIKAYLIPYYKKVRLSYLMELFSAQNDQVEMQILKRGPYRKLFSTYSYAHIEEYYYKQLFDFNHQYIYFGAPSIYTAIAYISLREIELKDIIHVIECVRYGVPMNKAPTVLASVPD